MSIKFGASLGLGVDGCLPIWCSRFSSFFSIFFRYSITSSYDAIKTKKKNFTNHRSGGCFGIVDSNMLDGFVLFHPKELRTLEDSWPVSGWPANCRVLRTKSRKRKKSNNRFQQKLKWKLCCCSSVLFLKFVSPNQSTRNSFRDFADFCSTTGRTSCPWSRWSSSCCWCSFRNNVLCYVHRFLDFLFGILRKKTKSWRLNFEICIA